MTRTNMHLTAALLTTALVLSACCGPAFADDISQTAKPDDAAMAAARGLADDVLRKAGGNDLGEWTRSIIERALERAGDAAKETVPGRNGEASALPAEGHARQAADGLSRRANSAEVILFTSLSVPVASWRQWARDAALTGAPMVLRGVGKDGLRGTVKTIGDRLGGHDAGVAIDPRLFRLFGIDRVPAVVVVPGGVPPCASPGCAEDDPPPFDLVSGNIGLIAALETIAAEGDAGRDAAWRMLVRMTGDER